MALSLDDVELPFMGLAADIQLYDLVLFVHVTAVVVAFGATFGYPFFQAVVERISPRSVPAMLRAMHMSSRYLVLPGSLVVLASGIYLTIDRWDFGDSSSSLASPSSSY